jgi:hypothetical protein
MMRLSAETAGGKGRLLSSDDSYLQRGFLIASFFGWLVAEAELLLG